MKRYFALALLLFSLAACTPLSEQVSVSGCRLESVDNLSMGMGELSVGAFLVVDAENSSSRDISLSEFSAEIFSKSDKKLATITLAAENGAQKPTLPRKSSGEVRLPLQIEFDNPITAITMAAMSLQDYGSKGFTVSYDCTFTSGLIKKHFSAEKVPADEMINMFSK